MRGGPTPAQVNESTALWEEYVSVSLVAVNVLVLSVTCVVGTAANVFVVLAVYQQKSLQTSANALLVNLAAVDFLRCTIDCPILLTIVVVAHCGGRVEERVCDTQMASFSFSYCVQLLTLACISGERYQAVAQPFKESRRKRRLMLVIPLMWGVAFVVATLCLMFLRNSPVYMRCKGQRGGPASTPYDTFGLYVLLPLWATCLTVIVGFYARIFVLLRSHNRKIFDEGTPPVVKEGERGNPAAEDEHKKTERAQRQKANVAPTQTEAKPFKENSPLTSEEARKCVSLGCEKKTEGINTRGMSQPFPKQDVEEHLKTQLKCENAREIKARASTEDPGANAERSHDRSRAPSELNEEKLEEGAKTDNPAKETSPHVGSPPPSQAPESTRDAPADQTRVKSSAEAEKQAASTSDQAASSQLAVSGGVSEAAKELAAVEGAVCMMPSKGSKERARKKKESKMAKRAGYIIVSFLFFWMPLIACTLANFLIYGNENTQVLMMTKDVEMLSVAVACITSLSNPIIYAAVNPQFRSEFHKLRKWAKSRFNKH